MADLTWRNWLILGSMVTDMATCTVVFAFGNFQPSGGDDKSLIDPAGYAFAIWAPIYFLGLTFVVAQMLPAYRQNEVVSAVAPFFAALHFGQALWYLLVGWMRPKAATLCLLFFTAAVFMALFKADSIKSPLTTSEWWLLRSNLSIHAGWLLVAAAVSTNDATVSLKASYVVQLSLAILSLIIVLLAASAFALLYRKPDAIIPAVVSWALIGIYQELSSRAVTPAGPWSQVVVDGFRVGAVVLSLLSLVLTCLALRRRVSSEGFGNALPVFVSLSQSHPP